MAAVCKSAALFAASLSKTAAKNRFGIRPFSSKKEAFDDILNIYSSISNSAAANSASGQKRQSPLKVDQNALLGSLNQSATPFNRSKFASNSIRQPFPDADAALQAMKDIPMPHKVHVISGRNNTHCSLTTNDGNVLCWSSAGTCGLRKAARGTSDAGYQAVLALIEKAKAKNIPISFGIHLRLSGFGPGREQAFRAIRAAGWQVVRITDYTPYRHAGCRPRKKRRL